MVNGALATQLQPVARMRLVERAQPQQDLPPREAPVPTIVPRKVTRARTSRS